MLTGPPGFGKTLLLRKLFHEVPEHFRLIRVYSTNLTFDELLNFICDSLGLSTLDADQNKKINTLTAHLRSSLEKGSHVVLLIDDAHELSENVLRQLLHLLQSNAGQICLPTIISGESVLEKLLARQQDVLTSRFEINHVRLTRLSNAEVADFIRHQLQMAGGSASEALLPAPVMQRIVHHARGIPQLVNAIGYHALLIAHLSEQTSVAIPMVDEAAGDALCDYLQVGTEPAKQAVFATTAATEAVDEPFQYATNVKEAVESDDSFFEWQQQTHDSFLETVPQFPVNLSETDNESTAELPVVDKLPTSGYKPDSLQYEPGSLQDELASLQALVRASRSANVRSQPPRKTAFKHRGLWITLGFLIVLGGGIAYLEYKRYDYVDFLADSTANLAAKLKEAGTTALSYIKTSTQSGLEQNHDDKQSVAEEPDSVAPALLFPDTSNSPDGGTGKPVMEATAEDADHKLSAVAYLRHGDRMLTAGDVTSARLFYEAAITTGDSEAITAIGRTFDPVSLTRMGLEAFHANPIRAAQWYLQAAKAGDPKAHKHREALRHWVIQSNLLTETQKRTLRRLLNEPTAIPALSG